MLQLGVKHKSLQNCLVRAGSSGRRMPCRSSSPGAVARKEGAEEPGSRPRDWQLWEFQGASGAEDPEDPDATRTATFGGMDLHRVFPDLLDTMLGNLLAESPDTNRLHYILKVTPMRGQINYWIVSRVSQERARAIRSSTALLRFTITLPEFDNSAEFPRLGHHVAQLALFISDPGKDLSQQAREGVYRLYQLLLHQRGLWQVLLGGAEKIFPPDGGQCWPSTISCCVSARLGCSSPTPSWGKPSS
ncbi:uncharacterized protein LOC120398419 [Mauremys reevesii]|uniref:uncharacterized protein LOC120398419 n=1 Tax=Mauremys reevesii TaxID=260615 RepID=UPI00193F1F8E|nr:uncharacterized protein LOC120398419 [Mauremys reevesii]